MFLSSNLRYLRERDGRKSQGKVAEELGITRSAVSSYEDGRAEPKLALLSKIAEHYQVSLDELINQDLSELDRSAADTIHRQKRYAAGQDIRILTVTLSEEGEEWVELVPEKAAAGYTHGYSDQSYLENLPKYRLPFLSKEKTYRAFEITGDSMLPLQSRSIVIGEYLQDWTKVKDGEICVVTSRTEGIVLKKIYNQITDKGTVLLRSTNITYAPYELPVDDIIDMWKFTAYISRSFPEEIQSSISELKEAFGRLETDVEMLKSASKTH